MHAEVIVNLATLCGFLLVLARISGVVAFVPIPGLAAGPAFARTGLCLVLAVSLFPVWPHPEANGLQVGKMLGWMLAEAGFGLTVGVAISFLLEGVQLASQIIGLEAGYSFASTVDPATQADSTTLQMMAQLFAGCLFFALGFDRQVIHVLANSLQSIPAGSYTAAASALEAITRLGVGIFSVGLQLAVPVLALTLLLDIAFAVLGRLHAQLQLLSLSFAAKMLAAVAFLGSLLSVYPGVFEKFGTATFSTLFRLLGN